MDEVHLRDNWLERQISSSLKRTAKMKREQIKLDIRLENARHAKELNRLNKETAKWQTK